MSPLLYITLSVVLIAYRQQAVTETLIAAYQRVVSGRPAPGQGLGSGLAPGLGAGAGLASGKGLGQGLTVMTLQLPVDWTLQTDPATNKTFYANNITNTSSWELPAGAGTGSMYTLSPHPLFERTLSVHADSLFQYTSCQHALTLSPHNASPISLFEHTPYHHNT